MNNRADADECFQETFLAALELSRREEVKNWRSLLQRLAAARAVDRIRERCRRRVREQITDWSAVSGNTPQPSQDAEQAELTERLRASLARIPAPQAEVFCLHALEGWSYQDIAEQLSLSINSVGVMLHRARKRLRELLVLDEEQARSQKDRL